MKPFTGVDYYALDDLLTSDERAVRATVREFVEREALPIIEAHHAREEFPRQLIPRMAALGMFGANLKGYGCAGLNNIAYGLICQELERADSGLRSMVSVQGSLCMYPIHAYGSEAQKQRWLPPMAAGQAIGCFGLTEPDHGSDPGNMETRARADGTDFVLNGTKRWITNGSIADVAIVWAKAPDGMRGFLVERGTPGFGTRDIKGKFSLRASITSELILDDVRVSADQMLPGVRGLRGPFSCLTQARFGIVWGALGAAMACYHTASSTRRTARSSIARSPGSSWCSRSSSTCSARSPKASCSPTGSGSSRTPARCAPSRSRSPSATTSATRSRSRAWRATSSALTASSTSIR